MDTEVCARIYTVMMVPISGQFVVLLEEVNGNRLLPIWIGRGEGESILIKLQEIELPRPITHDLMVDIVKKCDGVIEKVVITDLQENIYFARIFIKKSGNVLSVDSRPSDAIAVALRAGVEIFIDKKVLAKCPVVSKPISQEEVDIFKDKLETLSPLDFFKDLSDPKE